MKLKDTYKCKGKENENVLVFNFDLEAVLYTPCDKVSTIFYLRKLCTYNCTMFDLVSRLGYCYMWNETEGKRGSNEISSCLYRYLSESKAKEVVFFTDTCGGQNRNQYFSTMMMYIVETDITISSIDHIFMVQGHSHMEVDNMHSAIERKSNGLQIYDPYGWEVIAAIARKNPYFVNQLRNSDIIDVKALQKEMHVNNVKMNMNDEKVQWHNITWMRFEKENPKTIFYKYSYEGEFMMINTTTGRRSKRNSEVSTGCSLPKAFTGKLPISKAKKKDLMQLCKDKVIPDRFHPFYDSLFVAGDAESCDVDILEGESSDNTDEES